MKDNKRLYIFTGIIVIFLVLVFIYSKTKNNVPQSSYYTANISSPYSGKKNNSTILNVKTGLSHIVLAKDLGYPFFSRPIVSGDYSFIDSANYFQTYGVKNPQYKGYLVKVDNKTGKILWSVKFPNLVMNSPLVISQIGMVFVSTGNDVFFRTSSGELMRGTQGGGIYAIDINTGKILWHFNVIGQRKPTPVYKNGVLYSIGGNRTLYALSALNGKVLWSLNYGSISSQSSPLLVDNNLYFGGSYPYYFFDINIKTHKIQWKINLGAKGINSGIDDVAPVYSSGYIYTDASQLVNKKTNEGYDYLYKINANNGSIVWKLNEGYGKLNLPNGAQMIGSVPTVSGNMVYVGSTATQKILSVNTNTGKIIWSQKSIGLNNKPFIVVGDLLYYDNGLGNIQVYNKNTGKYIATRTTSGAVAVDGITYTNGKFYAVNLSGDFYIFK